MINKNEIIQKLMGQADFSYNDVKEIHQEELNTFTTEAQEKQTIISDLFESVGNIDEMLEIIEDQLEMIDESTAEEMQVKKI